MRFEALSNNDFWQQKKAQKTPLSEIFCAHHAFARTLGYIST
jgi:hypothetical protein